MSMTIKIKIFGNDHEIIANVNYFNKNYFNKLKIKIVL